MVTELKSVADWRRDGCDDRCELRMVIVPGLLGRQTLELHDPDAHEMHGRALAGDVAARHVLESGPLILRRRELQAWVDGREVCLTRTEWGVLLAIVDGNGALVAHETILARVWGAEYRTDDHLLRVNLSRLRNKLGPAAGLIETTTGLGFRFRFIRPGEEVGPPKTKHASLAARGKWSLRYAACQGCETARRPYYALGYCLPCYRQMKRLGAIERRARSPVAGCES